MSVFRDEIKDEDVKGVSVIEFVSLDLHHFRTVNKNNLIKTPEEILPPGSNYNRSDRLAIDASLGSRPVALTKDEFRKYNLHPVWTVLWDGVVALEISWSKTASHHIEVVGLAKSPLKIANQALFERSFGHVIVVTTEPGGDEHQHTVEVRAIEGTDKDGNEIKSNTVKYTVAGAW